MKQKRWPLVVSIVLLLHGWFCIYNSRRIQEHVEQLPKMNCEQLIENGPGGNNYVLLTDVRLGGTGAATHRDMDGHLAAYIPIYPDDLGQEPAPAEFRLLLEILDERDWNRLLATPRSLEFACEFWTPAERLDPWVHQVLDQKYPGIQVRKCRVVSVGLHEPTEIKAKRSWWYAIISFLMCGPLLVWFFYVRIRGHSDPNTDGTVLRNQDPLNASSLSAQP